MSESYDVIKKNERNKDDTLIHFYLCHRIRSVDRSW